MFEHLDEDEQQIVVDAMEIVNVPAGTKIIAEGDEGDCLYVVGTGTLACTKIVSGAISSQKETQFLSTYQPGYAFGELALLYSIRRQTTIVANEECQLFKLDRDTFNHVVKDSAKRKREEYEEFLKKVELFSTMEPYERSKLSESFKAHSFKEGDYVLKEGEDGTDLYFLQEGACYASKVVETGTAATVVMEYQVGDYFGELALLSNEPRAANVICKTDCKMVSMDRHSFKRLLGPLEKILRRNMQVYEKFTSKK